MKYLRKYSAIHSLLEQQSNESISNQEIADLRDELFDICEGALAYLLDDNFKVEISTYSSNPLRFSIILIKRYPSEVEPIRFTWDEVKDYYIPLLQLLQKNYTIAELPFGRHQTPKKCEVEFFTGGYENNTTTRKPQYTFYHSLEEVISDDENLCKVDFGRVIDFLDEITFIKIMVKPKL